MAVLRAELSDLFERYSQARQHNFRQDLLILDVDLSPLPASWRAEGAEWGYMGHARSKIGRKLVRVRAAQYQKTVWGEIWPRNIVESRVLLQRVLEHAEQRLGLGEASAEVQGKRGRTVIRLDSAWGSDQVNSWLLERGYQITGRFMSRSLACKPVQGISTWQPTSSPGRDVAPIPTPVVYARSLAQYAVRTPSAKKAGGYYYAVLFTSQPQQTMQKVVTDYDSRAGMEADIKSDKRGLALAVMRKQRLVARTIVVLLVELAHNVLVWARGWLAKATLRLRSHGIVRLVQEVWAVPGRVNLAGEQVLRVRLRRVHPLAREVALGWQPLLVGRPPGLVVS